MGSWIRTGGMGRSVGVVVVVVSIVVFVSVNGSIVEVLLERVRRLVIPGIVLMLVVLYRSLKDEYWSLELVVHVAAFGLD